MGKVRVHWTPETISDRRNIYLFSYKNCTDNFELRRNCIEAFDRKIINLSHFMIRIEKIKRSVFKKCVNLHLKQIYQMKLFFKKYFVVQIQYTRWHFALRAGLKTKGYFEHGLTAVQPWGHFIIWRMNARALFTKMS